MPKSSWFRVSGIVAILLLPRVLWAQACPNTGMCPASAAYAEVGTSGLQPVQRTEGSYTSGVVKVFGDANGVTHKKLEADGVVEDIVLTFDDINGALTALIDAYLDGRGIAVELLTTDAGSTKGTRSGMRLTDAQVRSIIFSTSPSTKSCSFRVTLRAREVRSSLTHQATPLPAVRLPNCASTGMRLTLNGVALPGDRLDSLDFQLKAGGLGTEEPDYANIRIHSSPPSCAVASSCNRLLELWHTDQLAASQVMNETQRSLSVVFLPSTTLLPPAVLQLDAGGVGMVARRPRTSRDSVGTTVFELYVETWNRLGRIPNPASPPPAPLLTSVDPAASAGAPADNAGSGSSSGAGSFRVKLPTKVFTGKGSLCTLPGDASTFIMQLDGPGGVGIIGATGVRLRVGTLPVAAEGDGNVHLGFTLSGGAVVVYTAKSGTFTFTKVGDRATGSFRVVADVTDVSNAAKEATIAGTFTDLPTTC